MSCYPGGSRALGVLLGFQKEICAFGGVSEQRNLLRASWWLYHAPESSVVAGNASWPTESELHALAQRQHARLLRAGGRNKRKTKLKLSVAQVRVLLRDLLLVASGLRPSCLVDCCALTKELAEQLLLCLEDKSEPYRQWTARPVRAVLLDGNVFFVNVAAFVHDKMTIGLHAQMYVDVSASLSQPEVLTCSRSEPEASRLQAFASWTLAACKALLSSEALVMEWKRPVTLNATALAGVLLCYPCVYDILVDGDDTGDEWREQENCLALCPLLVLQTSVLTLSEQMEVVLQDFSVPRHVLGQGHRFNQEEGDDRAVDSPLVKLLEARCRLRLELAIARSCFPVCSLQPQVRVDVRTLHRVAL